MNLRLLVLIPLLIFICNPTNGDKQTEKDNKGSLLPEGQDGTEEPSANEKPKIKKGELYLPEDYNKHEIPDEAEALGLNPAPLLVRVHVRIREIGDLNELSEKITVVMDVRLWWRDWQIFKAQQERLSTGEGGFNFPVKREISETKSKKLDPSFLQKIWKPDLFMENLFEAIRPEFIAKPMKLVYSPDGTLILQSRVTVTLSCNMDFHYYPADSQECFFRIRSYSFESEELELEWGYPKPSVYAFDRRNTNFIIQVTKPDLERLTEQSLELHLAEEIKISFGGTDEPTVAIPQPPQKNETFDVLTFSIKARRKMSYHMIQTYLPSFFFIAITWLCFFIPPTMVECRIGITMTTLLTLTAMFASVRESAPIVSYVKAIDIWMIACIVFVFLCLVEYALLVWFGLTKEEEDEGAEAMKTDEEIELRQKLQGGINDVEIKCGKNGKGKCSNPRGSPGGARLAIRIETFAVPVYFFLFILFNVIYWPWIMGSSNFFDWVLDTTYNVEAEATF